jgi:hypothetical protein
VIVAVTLAVAVVSVFVAATRSARSTTYGAASTAAAVADLAAGLGSIAAGCLAFVLGKRASLAALMTLIGVTWLAPDWIGWEGGPAAARSIAMIVAPFLVPLVLHLALGYPSGRLTGRANTTLVALAFGVTAIASVGRALFRDPFRDLHCWDNCTANVFLVTPDRQLTRFFGDFGWRATVAIGVASAIACAWRLAGTTPVARRSTWFVLMPACGALLATATYAVTMLAGGPEDPTRDLHQRSSCSGPARSPHWPWGLRGVPFARTAPGVLSLGWRRRSKRCRRPEPSQRRSPLRSATTDSRSPTACRGRTAMSMPPATPRIHDQAVARRLLPSCATASR